MKFSTTAVLGAGLLLGLVGCDDKASMTTFFGPEDQSRRVFQAANAQANCGAREDATLYPAHFTDGRLNSLGAAKLARIVPDDDQAIVHLYLDVPDNEMTAARKDAVTGYLKACGVEDGRLMLALGPNPNVSEPAAPGLSYLPRTDTATATPSSTGTGASSGAGSSAGYGPASSGTTMHQ
jgi:hypothetical protein